MFNAPFMTMHADADALIARRLPRYVRSSFYPAAAMIIAAIAWAALAQVDEIVVVRGRLVTTMPMLVVQPFEKGVITSMPARIGGTVQKGDVLVIMDTTLLETTLADLSYRSDLLSAEAGMLQAEIDGRTTDAMSGVASEPQFGLAKGRRVELAARLAELSARIKGHNARFVTLAGLLSNIEARREIGQSVLATKEQLLAREAGTRLALLQARADLLTLDEQIVRLRDEQAEQLNAIERLGAERDSLTSRINRETLERLVAVRRELEGLRQEMASARKRMDFAVIRAPADGTVLEVARRSVGSVIQPSETLLTLVPQGAEVEGEVEIATRDIGEIHVGDAARIKLDALPFHRHGTAEGRIRTVSEDVVATGSPAPASYVARVVIDASTLRDRPPGFRLMPGMPLVAEVKAGRRTVLAYFLGPLAKLADESLRER